MKRSIFFALAVITIAETQNCSAQTNYYWNGTGTVTDRLSWFTNPNGTGSNPSNFTTANQIFNIQAGQSATATALWTISGSGSRLQIASTGQFTSGLFNHSMILGMSSGGQYVMNNTSYSALSFATLDSSSTFRLDNQSSPRSAGIAYGGLQLNGTTAATFPGDLTINGTLQVSGSGQFRLASNQDFTHNINSIIVDSGRVMNLTNGSGSVIVNLSGNYLNSGTVSRIGTGNVTFNFSGASSSTATWGVMTSSAQAAAISIESGRSVTFLDGVVANGGIVNNGSLTLVNGSTVSSTITNTGTLQGLGTVVGSVTSTNSSTVRGDSGTGTGKLNVGNVTMNNGARIGANLASSGTNSQLDLNANTLNLLTGSKLAITGVTGFSSTSSATYTIASLTNAGGTSLQLDGVGRANGFIFGTYVQGVGSSGPVTIDVTNLGFTLQANDTFTLLRSGTDLQLTFTPVPEPVTILSVGAVVLSVGACVRKKLRGKTEATDATIVT